MKVCGACHTDLPKDSYSKKQWKLGEYQRRCKVCVTGNQEIKQPSQQNDDTKKTNEIIKSIDSLCLKDVEKISDEELFKQPSPPLGDCPICFLLLPTLETGIRYQSCCGKVICSGCIYAPLYDNQGNEVDNNKCPFCRTPAPKTQEKGIERVQKRAGVDDAVAMFNLGSYYHQGGYGYPQDYTKALELWHQAAELGSAQAYGSIGFAYQHGLGVEVDKKKSQYYLELSAIGGHAGARYKLGANEERAGNIERALRHHMIAVRSGQSKSLEKIKELYSKGYASKEDYTKALLAYQAYLGEIQSPQRDKAAAAYANCRYY